MFGKRVFRVLVGAIALVMVLSAAQIVGGGEDSATVSDARSDEYLTVGWLGDVYSWNPLTVTTAEDYVFCYLMYSSLFTYDEDWGGPVSDLATGYYQVVHPNGSMTTYINITTNAYFRGIDDPTDTSHPLTALDVAWTLNLIKNNTGGAFDWFLQDISYVTAQEQVPGSGVYDRVMLWTPYTKATVIDDLADIPILPRYHWEANNFDYNALQGMDPDEQIGSGPFMYESSVKSSWYKFKTAPNYHGDIDYGAERSVKVPGILYVVYSSTAAMCLELNLGGLDAIVLTGDLNAFENAVGGPDASVNIIKAAVAENGITDIAINAIPDAFDSGGGYLNRHPALLDPFVRQAIMMTLDKNYIVNEMLGGLPVMASSVVQPGFWQADIQNQLPFDPAAAKQLLLDNGWEDTDGDYWLEATEGAFGVQQGLFPVGTELSNIRVQAPDTDPHYGYITSIWPGWADDAGIQLRGTVESEVTMINNAWYSADYDIWIWHWAWGPEPIGGALSVWLTSEIQKGGDNCQMPMGPWWAHSGNYTECPYISEQMIEDYGIDDPDTWNGRFSAYDQNLTDAMRILDPDERKVILDKLQQWVYDSYTENPPYYDLGLYAYTDARFVGWGDWEAHPGRTVSSGLLWPWFDMAPTGSNLPPVFDQPLLPVYEVNAGETVHFEVAVSDPDGDALTVTWSFGDGETATTMLTGDTTYPTAVLQDHTYATPATGLQLGVTVSDGMPGHEILSLATVDVLGEPQPGRHVGYWWHNMFNESFGEWWDVRHDVYGNVEVVSDTYPFIYRTLGPYGPEAYYSNMRLNVMTGDLPEVNMNDSPMFLPYLGVERGGTAVIDWYMQYMTDEELSQYPFGTMWNDGLIIRLTGTAVLDEQAAMAVLGVTQEGIGDFSSWWDANNATVNQAYLDWMTSEDDEDRFDIFNMCEYPLTFLSHGIWAEKIGDDVIVHYDTVSWGMEALMTRWLHEAFMPTEWYFEDFSMHAEISPETADIDVDTAVVGAVFAWRDIATGCPSWAWRGMLQDYIPSTLAHPYSDFDPYADLEYLDMYAGSVSHGQMIPFGYTPGAFNLSEGEEMWFEWPSGPQTFILDGGAYWLDMTVYDMATPYSEPSGSDLPANVAVDPVLRTITFEGPMDVYSWSQAQTAHQYLADEWARLGVLPYGMPWIEFRAATEAPVLTSMNMTGMPSSSRVNETVGFTVTALDQFGEPYIGYDGTVTFSSSDPTAILPMDYTFTHEDNGSHYFEAAFFTLGEQILTVEDAVNPWLQASSVIDILPQPQGKRWTVMVYLDADNNLEDVALTDFLEMSSVGSTDEVDIVVQFDRIPGYDNDYGDWTGTLRFHVTQGMTPIESNAIEDLGELNMGDMQVLADFIEWGTSNYPADSYMLVLWDHGGGWNGAVCWDDTDMWDALTMDEVEQALASALASTGERIDILGYDACMMAMAEVMYETREYVDYVVASEELVPWDGWPYDAIMDDLAASPTMTPAELSSQVVTRYTQSYSPGDWATMSALDVAASVGMYDSLEVFAQELLAAMPEHKEEIKYCRANATEFMDWTAIDLYTFASMVSDRGLNANLTMSADELMAQILTAVIAEEHSSLFDPPGTYGVSIYFPSTAGGYWPSYETDLDFTAETSWDEFLVQVLSSDPDGYEPDDLYTEATELLVEEAQTHSLHTSSDVDWFVFSLDTADDVRIATTSTYGQWEITLVYIYDEYNVPYTYLAYEMGFGVDLLAVLDIYLEPGTYYVKVASYEVTEAYDITLYVGEMPNLPPVLMLDIYPWPYAGVSSTFDASNSYDPDGYIVSCEWDFGDGVTAEGLILEHTYDLSGVYLLVVVLTDDDGAQSSFSYELYVAEPTEPDQYEPDDTFDQASTIALGEVQEHNIAPGGGDIDWVTFNLTEVTTVSIETSVSEWGDTVIALYDEQGVPDSWIAYDDDSGEGACSLIVVTLQPGAYWVEIWSYWYWDEIPGYSISLTETVIENEPPLAYIWWWPSEPSPGQYVTFDAYSSWDPDGYIVSCEWDFGDGSTGDGWVVNHTYAEEGYYNVVLTVTDNLGATGSATQTILVHTNEPPVPVLTYTPTNPSPGETVHFDASGSYDPDGWIEYYYFDFGDGEYIYTDYPYVTHTYYSEGQYTVALEVVDSGWTWNGTSVVVTVGGQAAPPVAIAAYEPSMPLVGETVVFDGSNSFDPDGTIVQYIWQFGDGDVGYNMTATHVYEHEGTYQVTLTVMDGDLLVDENTVLITVASVPAASIAYSPLKPLAGELMTFYAYGSYDEGGIVEYVWSFGDGTYATGWEASHVYAVRGTYEVTLTVTNIYGVQSSAAVTVYVDTATSGVKGIVMSENDRPIKNALVEMRLNGVLVGSTVTDSTGAFSLRELLPGVYDLSISKRGYVTFSTAVTIGSGMLDLGTIILEDAGGGNTLLGTEDEPAWLVTVAALLGVMALAGAVVWRRKRTRLE